MKFELKINHEMKYSITQFNKISINNEWDVNELYDKIVEHKHVIIRAAMPGSGKSYACEYFKEKGHKILFVCPTNVLVQKYRLKGIDAVTVDKFFSISMCPNVKLKRFNHSNYDTVIFDEIYFLDMRKLNSIYQFVMTNNDKINYSYGRLRSIRTNIKSYKYL